MPSSHGPKPIRIEAPSSLGLSYYNSPFSHALQGDADTSTSSTSTSRVHRARASVHAAQGSTDAYAAARTRVLEQALAAGYDAATMLERGVVWGEDQDPFGHVTNTAFPRFLSAGNYRVTEGFARFVDRETAAGIHKGKGVCPLVRGYALEIRRAVQYPDSLIIANRLTAVKPDRYYGITTVWSLKQQAVVAECQGWIVWYDFRTGKAVNLLELGGVWKDLYHGLENLVRESEASRAEAGFGSEDLKKGAKL